MNQQMLETIMGWLSEEKDGLAVKHHAGDGFFVPRGKQVALQSGEIMDAVDWLLKEGFTGGLTVGGYHVVYVPPGGEHCERLTFFPIEIYRVPFVRSA